MLLGVVDSNKYNIVDLVTQVINDLKSEDVQRMQGYEHNESREYLLLYLNVSVDYSHP